MFPLEIGSLARVGWVVIGLLGLSVAVGLRPRGRAEIPISTPILQVQSSEDVVRLWRCEGPLAGLVVYLSPGHGWIWHKHGTGWQRPSRYGLIEDRWTADFAARYLIPALEQAGATVLSARERDPSAVSVEVGVEDALILGIPHLGLVAPEARAPVPLRTSLERRQAARVRGTVIWNLVFPADGPLQAYLWWGAEGRCSAATRVTLRSPGGVEELRVDQTVHGESWWPLGQVQGRAGDRVEVRLDATVGEVCAGGVRLGGGTVAVWDPLAGQVREARAYDLAAVHLLPALGAPWWGSDDGKGYQGDATRRARWAAWAHPEGEEAIYLSIHSDAGGGKGTAAFVRAEDPHLAASSSLAAALGTAIAAEVRQKVQSSWRFRGVFVDDLAELDPAHNGEMPAVLVEVGFHDRRDEAALLMGAPFQKAAAEGIVKGLVRWR